MVYDSFNLVTDRIKNLVFPGGSVSRESVPMLETGDLSLGQEDPLEKGMAAHPSILVWRALRQKSLTGYHPWVTKRQTLLSN